MFSCLQSFFFTNALRLIAVFDVNVNALFTLTEKLNIKYKISKY